MNAKHHFSLKKKTMIVMILTFAVTGIISILLFYTATHEIMRSEYMTHCTDLANTVAHSVDTDQVKAVKNEVMDIYRSLDPSERIDTDHDDDPDYEDYLSRYSHVEDMEEYRRLRQTLRNIQNVNHVECLYIIYPDLETHKIIYLVDGAYEDIWHPGTLEELYDTDFRKEGDIESGFGLLMSESDDYESIATTAMPIRDESDRIVAYAGLDYSMKELISSRTKYILIAVLLFILLSAVAAYIVIRLVDKFIVKPINTLSEASIGFYTDEDEAEEKEKDSGNEDHKSVGHRFSDLEIHTGDEIEALANSMAKMEDDINRHIEVLMSTRNELHDTREYAQQMAKSAFRDPLTGIRNKRAYDAGIAELSDEIQSSGGRFGIAVIDLNNLKAINDQYGHEAGNEAIIQLSGIICEVFRHSPVFRYGGDEFAVILRKHDLDHVEELNERFHNEMNALRNSSDKAPWLRHTAAIGYAIFDPAADDGAESVFERADKAMYIDKTHDRVL